MKCATLRAPTVRPASVARARTTRLNVQNRSLWTLQPEPKWAQGNPEAAAKLKTVDLTDVIGQKRMCSVGTFEDHLGDSDEVIKLEHGGIHVVFTAEGEANPLDSPSELYVTDIDSTVELVVNGAKVPKGERVQLKPGCVIKCGDDVAFQVLRNVFAHA